MISLRDNIGRPARSPDLSPCDYFLWGCVKAFFVLFFRNMKCGRFFYPTPF